MPVNLHKNWQLNTLELLKSKEAERETLHTLIIWQLNILTLLHQLEKKNKNKIQER